jgi:anti-sigma-K factor RskA
MTFDENGWQSSPQESWPRRPITKSNRWRAIAAVVSAVAIIALFALLLRGFVIGNGRSNPPGTP